MMPKIFEQEQTARAAQLGFFVSLLLLLPAWLGRTIDEKEPFNGVIFCRKQK